MPESEFARMLRLRREEREAKYKDEIDPVNELDSKINEKRRPLLSRENSPHASPTKKPKDAAAAARREKLARLAANLREQDQADRGIEIAAHAAESPPRRKRSSPRAPTQKQETPKKAKNSKWAALAAERAEWDNDFGDGVLETSRTIVMKPKTACSSSIQKDNSAKDMVQAALARAGKAEVKKETAAAQLKTKRINPRKEAASADDLPSQKRLQELAGISKSDRVSALIAGFTPTKQAAAPSTPKQPNLPAKLRETRLSESTPGEETPPEETTDEIITFPTFPTFTEEMKIKIEAAKAALAKQTPSEETTDDTITPEFKPTGSVGKLPKPKHLEEQRLAPIWSRHPLEPESEPETFTPNTMADRRIEEMKIKIEAAKAALAKQSQLDVSADFGELETGTGPNFCSTQIANQIQNELSEEEESESEDTVKKFELEEHTLVETPQPSYQAGHTVTYVDQKFNFLEGESQSLANDLKTQRTPKEIRKDTAAAGAVCFEAGDTPDKARKKKRRSASFCAGGSADDMIEFTGKSLQSFRRTQRVKRHQAKATAAAIFSHENQTESVDLDAERKKLSRIIDEQMNIIRQASQALNVCTDRKHGKGSFTQVDAERLLLVAMKKHEIAKLAQANLGKSSNDSISRGKIHVGNLVLKTRYQESFASPQYSNKVYWLMATIQIGDEIHATKLDLKDMIEDVKEQKAVIIPCNYTFNNVPADFQLAINIYSIAIDRSEREERKKEHGLKLFGGKLSMFNQRGSKKDRGNLNPAYMSPGGPNAVRKSNFKLAGQAKVDLKLAQKYTQYKLGNTQWDSIIQSVVACKIEPKFSKSFQFESFITVRSGSGGYGDWIRYWAVLSMDRITFWKYPEDKDDLPAEGHISLRNVVTPVVKAANRTMTKRPNTIELYQQQPKSGDRKNPNHIEGIVSDYDPNKLARFLLSADNAEAKSEWIKALNQMLTDLRAWERSLPEPVEDVLE